MANYLATLIVGAWLLPAWVGAQSPYAGWHQRPVKALSAEQLEDLRLGRGMSLALPAELNGHPGPKHVLELATELALTPVQLTQVERLFATMQTEARQAGAVVLAAEARLDELFQQPAPAPQEVEQSVSGAATAWGRLRWIHLRHHLKLRGVLTAEQQERYQTLRGYGQRHDHQH